MKAYRTWASATREASGVGTTGIGVAARIERRETILDDIAEQLLEVDVYARRVDELRGHEAQSVREVETKIR